MGPSSRVEKWRVQHRDSRPKLQAVSPHQYQGSNSLQITASIYSFTNCSADSRGTNCSRKTTNGCDQLYLLTRTANMRTSTLINHKLWILGYCFFLCRPPTGAKPRWKINSFLSEISVCWSCTEKITLKIERAFSVILRASPAIPWSFQPSPQHPTVPQQTSD